MDQIDRSRGTRGVFISYRRGETSGQARALHDRLVQRYGHERVFMDVDSIEPGADFVAKIDEAIESSAVALVLIGRDWLNPQNKVRLTEDRSDFIRLEIDKALETGTPIIPILVERATMPAPEELPESLRPLTRRNALELENQRWDYDVNRLVSAVEGLVNPPAEQATTTGQVHQVPEVHGPALPQPLPETSRPGGLGTDQTVSPEGRSGLRPPRRALAAIAIAVVIAIVLAVVAALPSSPPSKPAQLSAAAAVASVPPARLAEQLVQQPFGKTDVPVDVTPSEPHLDSASELGLVAPIITNMAGPAADIYVIYNVFASSGAATQFFATSSPRPVGFDLSGQFATSGIADQGRCQTSHSPKQGWASSCAVQSGNVQSFVVVDNDQNTVATDSRLASILTRAAVRHLQVVASSSPRTTASVPPGSLSPTALFAQLDSSSPKSYLLPDGLPTPVVTESSAGANPPQGLVNGSSVELSVTGPDTYGDAIDYVNLYVFDSAQDAASWYGIGLTPIGSSHTGNIDSSGFSQPASCGTYSVGPTSTTSALGISFCVVLEGDVVMSSETEMDSTSAYGNQDLAVVLARMGIMYLDLTDVA